MKRTNIYLSDKQLERLRTRAQTEGVAMAELIRRAVDAFLAWDDPTYAPTESPPNKEGLSSPALMTGAFRLLEHCKRSSNAIKISNLPPSTNISYGE